jgi:hypothetical protein
MNVVRRFVLSALLALCLPLPLAAQFGAFGTNKIQYRRFDWRVLRGEHVDLHFYSEEETVARIALTYAEESYRELEIRFRHSVGMRIPLIVYSSHADFEQTNILPFVPPEGLLGVTEFLKRRVALPFRGNYAEFRHTIRHELVHVFQLSKAALTSQLYLAGSRVDFPLWFSEGLAEYWSAGEDTRDEMILRDLTQRGRLPSMGDLTWAGGGIVYPIGGALVRFLAETYGDWRLVQAYDDAWKYDSFGDLLQGVFGRSMEQLSAEWQYAMRRRYYPQVGEQRPLELDAQRVATLAIKPAVWLPGDDSVPRVVFLSPRTGYTNVYMSSLAPGAPTRTLVEGERSAEFESFHAFDSRLDVSPAGVVVFTSRFHDRDALFFWDIRAERIVGRYQFPEIVSMLSPSWSPGGREVVFSGLSFGGFSDIYVLHLDDGRLERLTSDRYQDLDPSFSPDGGRIVFASDRTPFGQDGARNLFVLDRATGRTRYLTFGRWNDEGPRWSADGRITFTSDRRGVYDVYWVDSTGAGRRETAVPGGVFDPMWVPSVRRYVFGGFENLQFSIYSLHAAGDSAPPPEERVALASDTLPSGWAWGQSDSAAVVGPEATQYQRRFTLDFAAGDALYAPGYNSAQGAAFLLSDMLGDNIVFVSIVFAQQSRRLGDVIGSINGTALYLNQSRRLNWGAGVFRRRGEFYDGDFNATYIESTYGAFALLRYPLSRFTRVEGTFQLERSDRTDFFATGGQLGLTFPRRTGVLASNYFTYVHDNSLWLNTGPIDGSRTNITGGIVTDFDNARLDSWLISADLRRYVRVGLRTALALRGYGYYAGGERPRRVSMGGSHALRGYPLFSYVSGTRVLMGNAEWRFPITNYLSIGFPFADLRFPGIQGVTFVDAGRVWTAFTASRGTLGSYGLGLRMSLGAPLVLRFDTGWRYGQEAENGYSLPRKNRNERFASFWFGYNY